MARRYPSALVAVPELSVATIRRFCRRHTRPLSGEVALDLTVRGNHVTIWEWRRPHDDASAEWTKMPAAQLRYEPVDATWSIYWHYRDRWVAYDERGTALGLAKALKIIGDDKVGAFFG